MSYTRRQHYIPRVILKRHQDETSKSNIPQIWQYDKVENQERCVSIKDVCRENFLYEFRNADGEIILGTKNIIEIRLSELESKWGKILDKIGEHKPLSHDEICQIYILIAIQILRMPDMMKVASGSIQLVNNTISNQEADRYAKMASFPIGPITQEQHPFLNQVFEMFEGKSLVVFDSTVPFLLSGNLPIQTIPLPDFFPDEGIFFFPFSKFQCLIVSPGEYKSFYNILPSNLVHFINKRVLSNSKRFVYGSVKPTIFLQE